MKTTAMLLALLAASACATAPRAAGPAGDSLTAAQLVETRQRDAYEAVRALRPEWLRGRARSALTPGGGSPAVFIDGSPPQDASILRTIPAGDVASIRYLGSSDATTRFGTGHAAGALVVRTHRGPPPR